MIPTFYHRNNFIGSKKRAIAEEPILIGILNGRLKDIIDESDFEGNNILLDDIEECGICEYKNLCGGACRGRAYLFTGDMKKRDPYCLAAKRFYDNLFAQYTSI